MHKIRAFRAGLAFALTFLLASSASWAREDFMSVGISTIAPIGHRIFCKERPQECRPEAATTAEPLDLDAAWIAEIARINTLVNSTIEPASDKALFGVEERWTYPEGRGDCEDYVLSKRRRLHEAGIALSNLLITVVRKRNGEGHAVLTLRTVQGDFVLDNLDWRVRAWRETPYTFVKRQSVDDPGRWMSVAADSDVVVGSLKQ